MSRLSPGSGLLDEIFMCFFVCLFGFVWKTCFCLEERDLLSWPFFTGDAFVWGIFKWLINQYCGSLENIQLPASAVLWRSLRCRSVFLPPAATCKHTCTWGDNLAFFPLNPQSLRAPVIRPKGDNKSCCERQKWLRTMGCYLVRGHYHQRSIPGEGATVDIKTETISWLIVGWGKMGIHLLLLEALRGLGTYL